MLFVERAQRINQLRCGDAGSFSQGAICLQLCLNHLKGFVHMQYT